MKEKIQKHIDGLFTGAPKTRKALELKEELIQNAIEKYEDLIGEGYREEDAFQNVVSSIGDVTELFEAVEEKNLLTLSEADRKKKAKLTAAAVGLYIFAGVVFLFMQMTAEMASPLSVGYGYFDFGFFGLVLAGLICIPPTCMLVYAAHMYPSFRRNENSLVENFKEAQHTANKERAVRISVSALIWTLTLALYFIISFATMAWYASWVIFLIGGCAEAIAILVLNLRRRE